MPYTFDNVLDQDLITVLERDDDLGRFVIQLGGLKTPITIRLCRLMSSEETTFEVSHVIHTPTQADALNNAVFGLTSCYRGAVNTGYRPCEDWLVEA